MSTAYAVIGANYGDEGKGHFTNFVSGSVHADYIVRFNGGAQAGHTVVSGTQRHIFHHFGSTFRDIPTYLDAEFVSNPVIFCDERTRLGKLPVVFAHPSGFVTTVYDMLLNQAVEKFRARTAKRHGSVGLGFNETIVRNRQSVDPSVRLNIGELTDSAAGRLLAKLKLIERVWVPARLKTLGIADTPEASWLQGLLSRELQERFLQDLCQFRDSVTVALPEHLLRGKLLVFEGAQGLLLDQSNVDGFPHVTRSSTGLTNVLRTAQLARVDSLDVFYATRTYMTRHGAGLLDNEQKPPQGFTPDSTNIDHPYQGELRYAAFTSESIDDLRHRIYHDGRVARNSLTLRQALAVSWLDVAALWHFPEVREFSRLTNLPVRMLSSGADETTIKWI